MLSIILTTYNSEKTLKKCLDSVLKPSLSFISEVVVCDDGSTDNTSKILAQYEKKYNFLKVFFHKENLGGGAARNTAIKFSKNDYLYVLDSDDIVHQPSLTKLFFEIKDTSLSGVHYGLACYFLKFPYFYFNIGNYYSIFGNEITLQKTLKHGYQCVNFLFTKKAWEEAGGYPEDYAWDTQGFNFRFLSCNDSVKVIKNTRYYHRKFLDNSSYFDRENASGRSKINAWLVIENIENKIGDQELFYIICNDFFSKNDSLDLIKLALKNPDLMEYKYDTDNNKKLLNEFRLSIRKFELGEYTSSKLHAENALEYLPGSFLLIYNLQRSKLAISGVNARKVKLQAFDELMKNNNLVTRASANKISLLVRLKYYLKSILFPLLNMINPNDN